MTNYINTYHKWISATGIRAKYKTINTVLVLTKYCELHTNNQTIYYII